MVDACLSSVSDVWDVCRQLNPDVIPRGAGGDLFE